METNSRPNENIEFEQRDLRNAMFLAIGAGDSSRLAKLIEGGADVNAMDAVKLTATMRASFLGHDDCLRLLVRAGADLDAHSPRSVRTFNATNWNAAMYASKRGNAGCLQILATGGANLNAFNDDGWNATMLAARFGNDDCLRALASAGADLDAARPCGQTAAMTAARFGNPNGLRVLAEFGADLSRVDSMGETAADKATRNGYTACAEIIRAVVLAREERSALAAATAARANTAAARPRARSL